MIVLFIIDTTEGMPGKLCTSIGVTDVDCVAAAGANEVTIPDGGTNVLSVTTAGFG